MCVGHASLLFLHSLLSQIKLYINIMKHLVKLSLAILFAGIASLTYASTETRSLDNFSRVSISSGIKAQLVKGNKNEITIEAEDVDLDKIQTEVSNNRLKVKIEESWWKFNWGKRRKVSVVISYTSDLTAISASAGASVKSDNVIKGSELEFSSSSGASLSLEIDGSAVEADASSGAQLNLSGKAENLDVDVSSGAGFNGYELSCEEVRADASSGASAKVWASNKIKADASSGASVHYKGSPAFKDVNKSSGGSVSPK